MNKNSISGFWFFLGGVAFGLLGGVLLSPTIEDYVEREEREGRGQGLVSRMFRKIPTRVKAAGAVGAIRGGGKEAYHEAKEAVTGNR